MLNTSMQVIRVSKKRVSKGKYEFTENSQTWVNVTSETANVNYVNKAIKELWGDEYRLVTVDGIEIDDSPTTRGYCNHVPVAPLC